MKYRKTLIFMTAVISLNASAQQTFTYDGNPSDLNDYGNGGFPSSFGGPVWDDAAEQRSPSDNTVIIEQTLINAPEYVFGGFSSTEGVNGNTVNMEAGTETDGGNLVEYSIYGGLSSQDVSNNSIYMEGGTVGEYIYGGYSTYGNVSDNSINMSGGTVNNNLYGGFSSQVVSNNSIYMEGGAVGGSIYGGYSRGDVSNNSIDMSGGTIDGSIYGGYSDMGSALNNSIVVTGGAIGGGVRGGFIVSNDTSASGNSVFLNNAVITNNVYGAQSTAASASSLKNNSVTITGGSVGGHVRGASTRKAANAFMQGNSVVINSGLYAGSIYGAYGAGTIEGSKVTINGGQFSQNIFGGYVDEGDVTQSYITINGGHIQGDVYGGYGPSAGMISGHTIKISGGTIDGNIYGGVGAAPENITNNTLIFDGFQGTVAGIDGFDRYEFVLPSEMRSGDTQVIISTNAPNLSGASVQLMGVEHSLERFSIGDQLTLLSHVTNSDKLLDFKSESVKHGVTYTYDFSLVNDPNSLTLSVKDVEVNPQLKSLNAAQLSSLAFINQNADELSSISSSLVQRAMTQPIFSNSILTFARVNGGDSRYKTGSHVDVRGVSLLSGAAAYLKPTWLAGLFVEAGRGDFSSFNDFEDMASISARGNSRYYGGGILTRNDWDGGFYVDSALRLGQVETQYDSNDLFYLTASHYKTKALYFGAQAGLGYQMEMKRNFLLDLSARYLWNRQNGNTVTVAGDPTEINLQAINSHRSRAQAKLSYQGSLFSPFVHVAYENEFDSYAKAQVLGDDVPASSLAGGTAIGGVGVHIQSNENSRSYLNVRAQGFLGEREGYSAQLEAGWVF